MLTFLLQVRQGKACFQYRHDFLSVGPIPPAVGDHLHRAQSAVTAAMSHNLPVILSGPPRSGKRDMIRNLAVRLGKQVHQIFSTPNRSENNLTGSFLVQLRSTATLCGP